MVRKLSRRSLGRWIAGLLVVKSLPSPAAAPSPAAPAPAPAPIPLADSRDPLAQVFHRALMEERGVAIYYQGGSTPGALRVVRPESLFRLHPGGRIYVRGRCELRGQIRTFRLDRTRLA
jgi:predicted DNA-binding transcriptional regulator YafY